MADPRAIEAAALAALKKWRYAPGNYSCHCYECNGEFEGDKRATTCRPCAEKLEAAQPQETLVTGGGADDFDPNDHPDAGGRSYKYVDVQSRNAAPSQAVPEVEGLIKKCRRVAKRPYLFRPGEMVACIVDLADALTAERLRADKAEREVARLSDGIIAEGWAHTQTRIMSCDRLFELEAQLATIRAETVAECAQYVEAHDDYTSADLAFGIRALTPTAPKGE